MGLGEHRKTCMIIDKLLDYAEKQGLGSYFLIESSKTFEILAICIYNYIATLILSIPFLLYLVIGPFVPDWNLLWRIPLIYPLFPILIVGCVHGMRKVKDIKESQINYLLDIILGKIIRYGMFIIPFYSLWMVWTNLEYPERTDVVGFYIYISIAIIAYIILVFVTRRTIKEEAFAYIDWKLGYQDMNFSDFLSRRDKYRTSEAEREMMQSNLSVFGAGHRDIFYSMIFAPFIAATTIPAFYASDAQGVSARESASLFIIGGIIAFAVCGLVMILILNNRKLKTSSDMKQNKKPTPIGEIDGELCYGRFLLYNVQQRTSKGLSYCDMGSQSEVMMYLYDNRLEYYGHNGMIRIPYAHLADVSYKKVVIGTRIRQGDMELPKYELLCIIPKSAAKIFFSENDGFYSEYEEELLENIRTENTDLEDIAKTIHSLMDDLGLQRKTLPEIIPTSQKSNTSNEKCETESQSHNNVVMETKHAYLKPWIGENYNLGINGHKVLVLGASHYASAEEWNENFTINVIKDCYLNQEDPFDSWKRTYTKFERALAGYEISADERPNLWNKFMFWNFIQEPMNGPNKSVPSDDAIYTGQKAFLEIIEIYKPDRVIVWGDTLYGWLPDKGQQGDRIELPNAWKDGKIYDTETWEYTLGDDSICKVMPLADHPARGFAWEYYHLFIKEFLK